MAAFLTVWLIPAGSGAAGARTPAGDALDGGLASQADLSSDGLRIGEEYWLSLPQVTNVSGEPVTVFKARFVGGLPHGLELIDRKVVSTEDTGGYGMGLLEVKSPGDDVTGLPERTDTFTVTPHEPAHWYHKVRFRVTGPVTDDTSQCRFWYRQGPVKYR
ncbi:hypothetical protein [Streptomyces sp. NPDC002580]|uniref:hypothetical protein n=1 Tax=Streptomyces sp. NPDC002580 TaxID=3364653 RepID=UPI0036B099AB